MISALLAVAIIVVGLIASGKAQFYTQKRLATQNISGTSVLSVSTSTEYTDRDTPDHRRTTIEAFEALAAAAGKRWDGVDPEEFVREQRRD